MNGNAPNDPTEDAKAASRPAPAAPAGAAPQLISPAPPVVSPAPPVVTSAPPAPAGDLDLEVEEIKLPERLKEGFVGQER